MSEQVFPSVNGWITPRTTDTKLTTDNCQIILPKKIEKINKVVINAEGIRINIQYDETDSNIDLNNISTTQSDEGQINELDVTRFVVPIDEWKTLKTYSTGDNLLNYSDKKYAENTWYYSQNIIELSNGMTKAQVYPIFKTERTVTNVLIASALELLRISSPNKKLYRKESGQYYEIESFGSGGSVVPRGTKDPIELKFRVYYEPLGESAKLQVPKTEPQENRFVIPYSQQQPVVSNRAYGKNLQATANRTGTETRTVCRKCKTLDQIRKVGTIWREKGPDGAKTGAVWRLTTNDVTYNCGRAYCVETWSKNWMTQSEFVGINRQFRSWDIPADVLKRNLLYQDYCYLTTDDSFTTDGTQAISTAARRQILATFDPTVSAAPTEQSNLFIFNNSGVESGSKNTKGVVISGSAFGFGNSLVFNANTQDNLSAGTQRDVDDDKYCKDVYYCNDDGTAEKLSFQFAPEVGTAGNSIKKYPEVTSTENIPQGDIKLFGQPLELLIKKDPAEQLNFTYQIHFLTNEPDIVIGAGWAPICPLVQGKTTSPSFKFWTIDETFPQGMQTMSEDYGTLITNIVEQSTTTATIDTYTYLKLGSVKLRIDYNAESLLIGGHVCVTDSSNNVLLANFGPNAKTLYLRYTHDYDKLESAYYATHGSDYRDAIA